MGAELLLTSNACDLTDWHLAMFRTRAFENAVAVVMANYGGTAATPACNGRSPAFGADGTPSCSPISHALLTQSLIFATRTTPHTPCGLLYFVPICISDADRMPIGACNQMVCSIDVVRRRACGRPSRPQRPGTGGHRGGKAGPSTTTSFYFDPLCFSRFLRRRC